MEDVVILGGARTAIGSYGGSLKDVPPSDLAATVIRAAVGRSGVEPGEVGQVVMGGVIHSEPSDMYIARVAAIKAGLPVGAPALAVNRQCGSGVQAIVSAAQAVRLGETAVAVAGGAESMSRAPYVLTGMRWGQRMGNGQAMDAMLSALHDPFGHGHMGITAENVAERHGISREEQDAFALVSQQRAALAIAQGRFKDQIVPVELKTRKGTTLFDTDEHPRAETTAAGLAGLKPVFKPDGTVTAGNASGINDGAAALVLASMREAERRGVKPLARIVSWGLAGVPPELMGIGPVHAVPVALKRAGLGVADIDVIESNEAFAAQACAVSRELGFDPARVNPNGGAIALGHPVGATGAIVTVKALYELQRTGGRYGLITLCIGGGQGIALVIERI